MVWQAREQTVGGQSGLSFFHHILVGFTGEQVAIARLWLGHQVPGRLLGRQANNLVNSSSHH